MADLPIPAPDPLAPYLAEAEAYARRSKAENTLKAYRSDWAAFETFCRGSELPSLPAAPATVAAYVAEAARTLKANTVERRLTTISQAHQFAGRANPVEDKLVRTVMAGIRRVKGTAQRGKEPLSPDVLRKMFAGAPDDLRTTRDRGSTKADASTFSATCTVVRANSGRFLRRLVGNDLRCQIRMSRGAMSVGGTQQAGGRSS